MTPTDRSEQPPQPDEPTHPPAAGGGADAPPYASVAEEAAKLVELLSRRGWPASPGMPSGGSPGQGGAATGSGTTPSAGSRPGSEGSDDTGSARTAEHGQQAGNAAPGECTCGGTTPSACRVCPVCQVIALVQQVSPDTIERVADFVGFAAGALRELAAAQRERQASQGQDDGTGPEGGA